MIDLHPYQIAGANWLAPKAQAFLADDMGLGKSAQAIRAADMVGAERILVVCPASVRVNWEREFERFSPFDRPCRVVFGGKDSLDGDVVVCSYDLVRPHLEALRARRWDLVILDEAHYLKERSAKRTRAIYGRGQSKGLVAQANRVWRLSGTPAPNNASELWTHVWSAGIASEPYWDWVFRYCKGFEGSYGYTITGHKNVEELKTRLAPFMLRRKKADVMELGLPPIAFHNHSIERSDVELDPVFYEQLYAAGGERPLLDQIAVADKTLRQALDAINGGGVRQPNESRLSVLEGMAACTTTLRRYIGMAKLPACLRVIEEDLTNNPSMKIVLFAVHKCVIEAAREGLKKFHPVTLYGGTPPEKRQANIDKFVRDKKTRVFIGNVQAAGTGVDGLQKVCSEVAFLEQSWVPAENAQAAMRVHRIGQEQPVRVRIFGLYRSVDEQVQETLARKMRELVKIDL